MSNDYWQLLADIQRDLKRAIDLPTGVFYGIAQRLDDAITNSARAPLDTLNAQLKSLLEKILTLEPLVAQSILHASAEEVNEKAAYIMGQISFAQLLAAQAAERRIDSDFEAKLNSSLYKPYVDALVTKELNGKELASICKETEETVSRKLKQLREFGITEFRREGTSFYNFLTPVARAIIAESGEKKDSDDSFSTVRKEFMSKLTSSAPPYMQHAQSLSIPSRRAA